MDSTPFQIPPVFVTLAEAARLLSVSLRTVQRMVARGELEVIRLTPDTPRIRYEDVVRFCPS
jgi:excisionase family DNA binding protein